MRSSLLDWRLALWVLVPLPILAISLRAVNSRVLVQRDALYSQLYRRPLDPPAN